MVLKISGKSNDYLADIDKQAEDMFFILQNKRQSVKVWQKNSKQTIKWSGWLN